MIVYRIEKASRAEDWPAKGALFAEGRWNAKGFWVIYCSATVSLAKLETLANARALPQQRVLMKIAIANQAPVYHVPADQLPADWTNIPYPRTLHRLSREILQTKQYVALGVPSRQSPSEHNFLLYPLHPRFSEWVTVESISSVDFDTRLKP